MDIIYRALFRFLCRRMSPWKLWTHDEMATFGREYDEGMRTGKHGFYETWVGAWCVMTKRSKSKLTFKSRYNPEVGTP